MDELSQALERVCFLDWRLEQLEATLQDAHARNQGLRRELAEVSGARQRELAEQASLSERLTEARREAQSLEERLALSERARASSEAHARGLDRRWMERLAEAQAQGERERQRAEVASRALADARQRLDVLERAHAAFFLRLESWQRLLGQDPDHVDLAEFISDLRAEIERLSEEQVRAHRRETRLRLALVETGARVPAEAALVAPLPEEEATARRGPPQVSLRDAVLGRRARRPADRSAARLDVDRSPSARVPAADAPTAHAPAAAAPRATPAPAGLVRKDAFDALETARPGPVADAHAGLLWEVAEASQDRALAAARTLAERVGAAAAPAVILRLNAAADPEAQVAWLGALARTAGPVAEQAALRCASDEVWSVRAAATDALAALTEGTARRDALRRALADPDARVRRRAALAAAQWLGRDAEPLVAPLLEDPSPGTRRLATTILRRASTRRVGQALAPALTPKRSPPMEHVTYPRKRIAELLDLSEAALQAAETDGVLAPYGGPKEAYAPSVLSAYRAALGRHPPRRAVRRQLFLNFKGGTGKTSLSVSYAHRLAELGNRVLLVDLDSQGHASKCIGYEGESCEHTLYDVLVKKLPITDARVETPLKELHLVPSNLRMATVDLALMPLSSREYRMKKALEAVTDEYDYVVLDAPPAFGLLNLNAIVAAHDLFIPVLPDFLSFHGLKLLFETLDDIEEDLEHRLDRIFVVINQFNPTTTIARAARDALVQHYSDYLLPEVVRQCTKFAQASSEGMPIFAFDATSKGAKDVQRLIDDTALPPAAPAEQEAAV